MYRLKFLKNFPFGVFIGAMLGILLSFVLGANITENFTKFYIYVTSAFVSLFAAGVALSGVLASLDHQNRLRDEERKRRLSASRAFLPQALSEMCEVAKWGMINSHRAGTQRASELEVDFLAQSIQDIGLSDEIVAVFRSIIEHSDGNSGNRVQWILREHQVFRARWRSFTTDRENIMPPLPSEVAQRTVAWAFLHALTATTFPYARGDTDHVEELVDEALISSALNSAGIHPIQNPDDYSDAIGLYARHFIRHHQ